MKVWVIKNSKGFYFIETPDGNFWTKRHLTIYTTIEEAKLVIAIFNLKCCKPVKIRIKEIED